MKPRGSGGWSDDQKRASILDKSVTHSSGCRLWTAARRRNGYGVAYDGTKSNLSAHRLSYEVFVGPIPDGLCVCHKCDVRHCVEPARLFLGTKQENSLDCAAKGRNGSQLYPERRPRGAEHRSRVAAKTPKGEAHPQRKLTDDAVRLIRRGELDGVTLANMFGVSTATISSALLGKTWRHIK